jgi:hypothetical protein
MHPRLGALAALRLTDPDLKVAATRATVAQSILHPMPYLDAPSVHCAFPLPRSRSARRSRRKAAPR